MVITFLDTIFDAMRAMLTAGGQILKALTDHSDQVIKWLDQELKLGFFGSFYNTLAEQPLSVFELTCMLAAIPAHIRESSQEGSTGSSPRIAATALSSQDQLKTAVFGLHIATIIAAAGGGFVSAQLPLPGGQQGGAPQPYKAPLEYADYFFTAMAPLASIAAEICWTLDTRPNDMVLFAFIVVPSLVMAACILEDFIVRAARAVSKMGIGVVGLIITTIYNLIRLVMDLILHPGNVTAVTYQIAGVVGNIATALMRYKRPFGWPAAAGYAGLRADSPQSGSAW